MDSIYFVRDTARLTLELPGKVLCLNHKSCEPPHIDGADFLSFAAFHARYDKEPALLDYDHVIFVGTNRIITPSNRTDPVFEVLFSGTRHIDKISVDNVPFLVQPWRAWFHFGITNTEYSVYDYSYKAESDWNKYLDGVSDYDPFSLEEMIKWSRPSVQVNYEKYFNWTVIEIQVLPNVRAEYEDLKAELFETESGPKPVVQKLARFARAACPQRKVPQPHVAFRKPNVQIVKTDLPVDDYLIDELISLMELTNDYLWSIYQ